MTMYEQSQQSDWLQTELESMSSQEASPAKTYQSQDTERGIQDRTGVDCGQSAPVCLGSFDLNTPSLKTSQTCLMENGELGLSEFCGIFPQLGYDAEWHCIPASELGAHHHRDRIWIIAYPSSVRHGQCVTEANTANGTTAALREAVGRHRCRPRWTTGDWKRS